MDGLRAGKKTGGEKLRRCGGSGTDGSGGGGRYVKGGCYLTGGGESVGRGITSGSFKRGAVLTCNKSLRVQHKPQLAT